MLARLILLESDAANVEGLCYSRCAPSIAHTGHVIVPAARSVQM